MWPALWLADCRLKSHVQDVTKFPVLIFPEGTCINNTSVMMFKKGSFEVGGTIYPVAIKVSLTLYSQSLYWQSLYSQSLYSHYTDSHCTLSHCTLTILTVTILSVTVLSVTVLSVTVLSVTVLSVTILTVTVLSVTVLSVTVLSVTILTVTVLSVTILTVTILSVTALSLYSQSLHSHYTDSHCTLTILTVTILSVATHSLSTLSVILLLQYDSRFADCFWNSSKYTMLEHIGMLLTSWAIVADVWYLPPATQLEGESAISFANRIKSEIAQQGGLVDLEWLVSVSLLSWVCDSV